MIVDSLTNESGVKLSSVVEVDLKDPFSIISLMKCEGWRYSSPLIAPLYN